MHPHPCIMLAGEIDVAFVGSTTTAISAAGSAAIPLSTLGASVGDLLFYTAAYGTATSLTPAAGFASNITLFGGSGVNLHGGFKVLTAGEIASPPSFSAGAGSGVTVAWALYRGPNGATLKGSTANVSSTTISPTPTSFSPAANHRGLVVLDGAGDTGSLTSPSGGVSPRVSAGGGSIAQLSDKLHGYAAETITVSGPSTFRAIQAYEMTRT